MIMIMIMIILSSLSLSLSLVLIITSKRSIGIIVLTLLLYLLIKYELYYSIHQQGLLSNQDLAKIPLLILGNKIDIPRAMSEDELRNALGLYSNLTTGKVCISTMIVRSGNPILVDGEFLYVDIVSIYPSCLYDISIRELLS